MGAWLLFILYLFLGIEPETKTYWIAGDSEAGATHAALKAELSTGTQTVLTYEVSSRIEKWAAGKMQASKPARKVDYVIVFLGTNNYYDANLPSVDGVLQVVRSTGARCVWVGPPKVNGKPWKLNADLRKAVESVCVYVDSQQVAIELHDGIHPSPKGAQVWARKIVESL
jgi:lysophospholipase L1-like esterase